MFVLLFVVIIVLIVWNPVALGPPKRVFQRVAVQGQFCPEKSNHRMLSLQRRLFSEQVVQVILCDGIEDVLVL